MRHPPRVTSETCIGLLYHTTQSFTFCHRHQFININFQNHQRDSLYSQSWSMFLSFITNRSLSPSCVFTRYESVVSIPITFISDNIYNPTSGFNIAYIVHITNCSFQPSCFAVSVGLFPISHAHQFLFLEVFSH